MSAPVAPMMTATQATPTTAPVDIPVKKEKKPRGPNKWSLHVQEFRAAHPELSFKECLQQAKKTYTKETA